MLDSNILQIKPLGLAQSLVQSYHLARAHHLIGACPSVLKPTFDDSDKKIDSFVPAIISKAPQLTTRVSLGAGRLDVPFIYKTKLFMGPNHSDSYERGGGVVKQRKISPLLSALDDLPTPLNTGEKRVLNFFIKHLDPAWEIYIQPHMNGCRPDFVLLNPNGGIAVFEVKDWNFNARHFYYKGNGKNRVLMAQDKTGGPSYIVRDNPFDKIEYYENVLMHLYCPSVGQAALTDSRYYGLITAGVIFPSASRGQVEAIFGKAETRNKPVACAEDLILGQLKTVFPEGRRTHSVLMNDALAKDLRSWLDEPDADKVQRTPLILDGRQKEIATTRTKSGFRRLNGPAGSGKSVALAGRAAELAMQGKSVLALGFNITMSHYLHDLVVRYPGARKVVNSNATFSYFHSWCKLVCMMSGYKKEYESLFKRNYVLSRGLDAVLNIDVPALVKRIAKDSLCLENIPRYDGILVDEGQDFNLEWWQVLRLFLKPAGEMLLAADKTQDLYHRSEAWTDASMRQAGFSGPWIKLQNNYRIPQKLLEMLEGYANNFLKDVDVDLPRRNPQTELQVNPVHLIHVPVPKVFVKDGMEQASAHKAADLIAKWVNHLGRENSLTYSDITFLTENHRQGLAVVDRLEDEYGIKSVHVFGKNSREQRARKFGFYQGDSRVKGSTIESFKGWESRALVIVADNVRPEVFFSRLYVALTRLKKHPKGSFLLLVTSDPQLQSFADSGYFRRLKPT